MNAGAFARRTLTRFLGLVGGCWLALGAATGPVRGQTAAAANTNGPATPAELRARIQQIISQPRYDSALWGVKVVQLARHQVVFEANAGKLFSPASNTKLYSMALALDRLGPDFRIRTSLYATTPPDNAGTVAGDLVLFGRGDPTLNARLHGGSLDRALEPLVAALTNAGIHRITGDIIGDDSFFHGPPIGAAWEWEDLQEGYGAEISALSLNDNTVKVVVKPGAGIGAPGRVTLSPPTGYLVVSNRTRTVAKGPHREISLYRPLGENVVYVSGGVVVDDATGFSDDVAIHNPAGWFATRFQELLARNGIVVGGRARSMNWLDREVQPADWTHWRELGAVESLPVSDLLGEVLKPSQNLYTDLLLAQVGMHQLKGRALGEGETSEAAGLRALRTFLGEAGVPRAGVVLNEGSGLSRNNLVSPNATVALLEFMHRHAQGRLYAEALPIAGVDGSLRRRMKGTAAEGKVRAKTGTLAAAISLAGYVTTAGGEPLAFALMLNRYQGGGDDRPKTADLDAIAVLLAGFNGRLEQP